MASGKQGNLASQLAADFGERYGEQSAVLANLRSLWTPIAQAGPDQQGFGANELAAITTGAREGVADQYAKASRALNTTLATRGGGSEVLPTGASAALRESLASAAANESARQQQAITTANYAQGRQNWREATAGLQALASQYNPSTFSGQASAANEAQFNMEKQINQERAQKMSSIIGGITGLAANFIPGGKFLGGIKGLFGGGGPGQYSQNDANMAAAGVSI